MASGTRFNLLNSSQPSQLVLFTCGYFMLCVISSSSERASGRNIHVFQNLKSNLCLQRWSVHPTYCTCTLSCNLMLSDSTFRPSCHDGATEMRVFQAVLERLAKSLAYTLPLSQLCRCCLCGCTERKKSSTGRWETWFCLAPPALEEAAVASSAALPCSRCDVHLTWFAHKPITFCSCLGFRSSLCYFNLCLLKVFVATTEIKGGQAGSSPGVGKQCWQHSCGG